MRCKVSIKESHGNFIFICISYHMVIYVLDISDGLTRHGLTAGKKKRLHQGFLSYEPKTQGRTRKDSSVYQKSENYFWEDCRKNAR